MDESININQYGFECSEWFLVQTAHDYDITLDEAKLVFDKSHDSGELYDNLEAISG